MTYSVDETHTAGTLADLRGLGDDGDAIREAIGESELGMLVAADAWQKKNPREVASEFVSHEQIEVGDIVRTEGFTAVVVRIKEWPNPEQPDAPITYGIYVAYLSGSVKNFRWFRPSVCCGCFTGELAYIQGNRRARITRAFFDYDN